MSQKPSMVQPAAARRGVGGGSPHRFLLSGDDQAELFLGTNQSKFTKRRIAHLPRWTPRKTYTTHPTQISEPIHLTAGRPHYLEILRKEGGGNDHLAVAIIEPESNEENRGTKDEYEYEYDENGGTNAQNPQSAIHNPQFPSLRLLGGAHLAAFTTDPLDQDDDDLPDAWEQKYGFDPTTPNNPQADTDEDGLTNAEEVAAATHPRKKDTDKDGLTDAEEAAASTGPRKEDSDGNGFSDGQEINAGTDPRKASTNLYDFFELRLSVRDRNNHDDAWALHLESMPEGAYFGEDAQAFAYKDDSGIQIGIHNADDPSSTATGSLFLPLGSNPVFKLARIQVNQRKVTDEYAVKIEAVGANAAYWLETADNSDKTDSLPWKDDDTPSDPSHLQWAYRTKVEVQSLYVATPAREIDDGDENPDTTTYLVAKQDSGDLTIHASPDPNLSEDKLPDDWKLDGGTGTGKLERTIDLSKGGTYELTASCDRNSKTATIHVVDLDEFKITDAGNSENFKTDSTESDSTPEEDTLYLLQYEAGFARLTLSLIWKSKLREGKFFKWQFDNFDGWSNGSGSFEGSGTSTEIQNLLNLPTTLGVDSIFWTEPETDSPQRKFTLTAWFDEDGDGIHDAGEQHRRIKVEVVKVVVQEITSNRQTEESLLHRIIEIGDRTFKIVVYDYEDPIGGSHILELIAAAPQAKILNLLNKAKKLSTTADIVKNTDEIAPGLARRMKWGKNWIRADINKAISLHLGGGGEITSWVTKNNKRIYENARTGRQIVRDLDGGYFRIFQPNKIGGRSGKYLV